MSQFLKTKIENDVVLKPTNVFSVGFGHHQFFLPEPEPTPYNPSKTSSTTQNNPSIPKFTCGNVLDFLIRPDLGVFQQYTGMK